jgi:pseudaminic acid biosynthesis-associated methylase
MATEQEEFWKGDFGRDYTARNRVDWRARVPFWRGILEATGAKSILEVGCNAAWNLRALREVNPLHPLLTLYGMDINHNAVEEARAVGFPIFLASAMSLRPMNLRGFDLVFTAGVLIHIAPADLEQVMREIIWASNRYVLAVEYAADEEQEISYRGHAERLWKRPFGKLYEALGLKLIAEGEAQGFDRCHYWLMSK